jgi:hypothetical protein
MRADRMRDLLDAHCPHVFAVALAVLIKLVIEYFCTSKASKLSTCSMPIVLTYLLSPGRSTNTCQHTSAYVSILQHTSAYVSIRQHASAYVSIRQHTSAYVSIRQQTSAYVSIRQHTSACVSIRQHTSAYVSIRQHTSADVSIRQHTSAYVSTHLCVEVIVISGNKDVDVSHNF